MRTDAYKGDQFWELFIVLLTNKLSDVFLFPCRAQLKGEVAGKQAEIQLSKNEAPSISVPHLNSP